MLETGLKLSVFVLMDRLGKEQTCTLLVQVLQGSYLHHLTI